MLVNPMVTPLGREMVIGFEGCLSVPDLRGLVPRYARRAAPGARPRGTPLLGRRRRLLRPGHPARVRPPRRRRLPRPHEGPAQPDLHARSSRTTSTRTRSSPSRVKHRERIHRSGRCRREPRAVHPDREADVGVPSLLLHVDRRHPRRDEQAAERMPQAVHREVARRGRPS